jgi:ribosome biogenesis GTPase A
VHDYKVITEELKSFDPALAAKPTILVAAKVDVANPEKLKKLTAMAKRRKLPFYKISAVTGEGVEALKYAIAEMVAAHRPIDLEPPPPTPVRPKRNYPPPPTLPGTRLVPLHITGPSHRHPRAETNRRSYRKMPRQPGRSQVGWIR